MQELFSEIVVAACPTIIDVTAELQEPLSEITSELVNSNTLYPSTYYEFLDQELDNISSLLSLTRDEVKIFQSNGFRWPIKLPKTPIKKVGLKDIPFIHATSMASYRLYDIDTGYILYQVNTGQEIIEYVEVTFDSAEFKNYISFVVIAPDKFWKLVRYGQREYNKSESDQPLPIMDSQKLELVLDNTINFLKRRNKLKEYGVKTKNGILLTGPPGNGKTMLCNYIKSWCIRKGVDYVSISPTELHRLIVDKELDYVLRVNKVVFFDDVDISILDSSQGGHSTCSLKSAMSGMNDAEVSIKIFTTNEDISNIDPAILRPGRIDLIVEIEKPTRPLREEYINKFWSKQLVNEVNPYEISKKTENFSFAELELLGSLAVRNHIFHGVWDINQALVDFNKTRLLDDKKVGF